MRKNLAHFFLSSFLLGWSFFYLSPVFAEEDIEYRFERMWPQLEQPWYFNGLTSVAIAPDGNVYVTEFGEDRIQQFTSQGDFIRTWGSKGTDNGQFNLPTDIAIASDSSVYVADYRNHVSVINSREPQNSPETFLQSTAQEKAA